jgi:uncharacterized protein YndB with AHSA1/START domain
MSERPAGTRRQEHEIVIDAPIEAVWKAITDAEELTRWFVEQARVEPGVGGTIALSWDGPPTGSSRIDAWEPNRRLRVTLGPMKPNQDAATQIVDEYTIERRDGKTVLRLVSSGIPDSPDWDGFYSGTNSGWPSFFRTLRHYLEHHCGKPRTTITIVGTLPGSLEEAWARLTGSGGFGFDPIAGQAFSTNAVPGDPLTGRVVFAKAPNMLELSVHERDAFLAHAMSSAGGNQYVYSVLSVYGKSPSEVDAIRAAWQPWLKTVLGI